MHDKRKRNSLPTSSPGLLDLSLPFSKDQQSPGDEVALGSFSGSLATTVTATWTSKKNNGFEKQNDNFAHASRFFVHLNG